MSGKDHQKSIYSLGGKRELFLDDFFIAQLDGDVSKRLHEPVPDNLILTLDEPIHPGALGHLEMAKEIFRIFGIYDPAAPCSNPAGTPMSIEPFYEK